MIIGRSLLEDHEIFVQDNPGTSAASVLSKAVEILEQLDRDNRLARNCAKFIRQLSNRQSKNCELAI